MFTPRTGQVILPKAYVNTTRLPAIEHFQNKTFPPRMCLNHVLLFNLASPLPFLSPISAVQQVYRMRIEELILEGTSRFVSARRGANYACKRSLGFKSYPVRTTITGMSFLSKFALRSWVLTLLHRMGSIFQRHHRLERFRKVEYS